MVFKLLSVKSTKYIPKPKMSGNKKVKTQMKTLFLNWHSFSILNELIQIIIFLMIITYTTSLTEENTGF